MSPRSHGPPCRQCGEHFIRDQYASRRARCYRCDPRSDEDLATRALARRLVALLDPEQIRVVTRTIIIAQATEQLNAADLALIRPLVAALYHAAPVAPSKLKREPYVPPPPELLRRLLSE